MLYPHPIHAVHKVLAHYPKCPIQYIATLACTTIQNVLYSIHILHSHNNTASPPSLHTLDPDSILCEMKHCLIGV